jgi:hypothetical protein
VYADANTEADVRQPRTCPDHGFAQSCFLFNGQRVGSAAAHFTAAQHFAALRTALFLLNLIAAFALYLSSLQIAIGSFARLRVLVTSAGRTLLIFAKSRLSVGLGNLIFCL